MVTAVANLARMVGVAAACRLLGVPRSTYYRVQAGAAPPAPAGTSHSADVVTEAALDAPTSAVTMRLRGRSARALSTEERAEVRAVLNSERFADLAPREVYATLLDAGVYLCSWSTMYRILREAEAVRRRRDQQRGSTYAKPELLATRPRQRWSWDITKLKGPTTWTYFYLYVIIDVYSRYVVGWMIVERESAELAEAFIAETCTKEGIQPSQLTLHADRGSAMTSKGVAQLLADLGVTKTHSRPQVSNDNPFSEAQCKTMKYHPTFPQRFGSLDDARAWARTFFQWYNHDHYHTGIGLLTPATVHHEHAPAVLAARQQVLHAAYHAHPERFVRGQPQPPTLPAAVWINPPIAATGRPAADNAAGAEWIGHPQPCLASGVPTVTEQSLDVHAEGSHYGTGATIAAAA